MKSCLGVLIAILLLVVTASFIVVTVWDLPVPEEKVERTIKVDTLLSR